MTGWERVRQSLDGQTLLALAPGYDFRYVAGWSPIADERPTWLLLGAEAAMLLVPAVNADEAKRHVAELPLTLCSYPDGSGLDSMLKPLSARWTGSSRQRLLLSDGARFDHAWNLLDWARRQGWETGLASEVMGAVRLIKTPAEQEALARAQQANDCGMAAGLAALAPGITEIELAEVIRKAFLDAGADAAAFILVAFGEHTAYPHHQPTTTALMPGPVLLDIGCYRAGYASDMTRMAYFGTPSKQFGDRLRQVEEAVAAALAAATVGRACADVDQAARSVLKKYGAADRFVHRTGHGIGLEVHERPSVDAGNPEVIAAGMAFSIEPGIYYPGEFGIRLEEVVLMQADGPRILSQRSRDLFVQDSVL